jgi:thiol-disulfide isomerase/thioredoxin
MKTKINSFLLTTILSLLVSFGVSSQTTPQLQNEGNAKVEMYYFHFNTRCETCRAVESEAQQDVKELFGNDVSFAAYNLDEPAGEAKGKELGVNSQSLIVVKGDKKINLTNEGFMYARTNPEKLKKVIEEKIKPLL